MFWRRSVDGPDPPFPPRPLEYVDKAQQPGQSRVRHAQPEEQEFREYKPVTVATSDGKVYNGMPVVIDGRNLVLLLSDGTKATIPKTEIDQKKESNVSVMPTELLNALNYQEIADLLALFNSMPRVEVHAVNKQ
jgi:putative heme-binding domain-containing protein